MQAGTSIGCGARTDTPPGMVQVDASPRCTIHLVRTHDAGRDVCLPVGMNRFQATPRPALPNTNRVSASQAPPVPVLMQTPATTTSPVARLVHRFAREETYSLLQMLLT